VGLTVFTFLNQFSDMSIFILHIGLFSLSARIDVYLNCDY
jgi:hypothetical protein